MRYFVGNGTRVRAFAVPGLLVAIAVSMLAGCSASTPIGAGSATGDVSSSPSAPGRLTPAYDPYQVYLKNNPNPKLVLSREDAQTRAILGCGTTFAPDTVDRVLADAYRPMGICNH